jgi:hypothetical protein
MAVYCSHHLKAYRSGGLPAAQSRADRTTRPTYSPAAVVLPTLKHNPVSIRSAGDHSETDEAYTRGVVPPGSGSGHSSGAQEGKRCAELLFKNAN